MNDIERDRRLLAAACLLGLAAVAALSGRGWLDGALVDTDSYMRLAFLEWALEGGGLRAYLFGRDGAPWGMETHWTLPFNLAVAALAAPLAPFLGWHGALAAVAPLVGPPTFLAAAASVAALARSLGLRAAAPWAAGVAALAPSILSYAKMGRVDHHVVTVALGTLALAAALRLSRTLRARDGAWAAAWTVLASWQSMETILAVAAAWGAVVIGTSLRFRSARGFLGYAACLAVGGAAALVADPPPEGALSLASDRHSALHAAMMLAMAAAVPAALLARGRGGPWRRVLRGGTAAAVPLAAWAALALAASPKGGGDSAYEAYFWTQVSELLPVWSDAGLLAFGLLPAAPALLVLARGLWLRRHRPQAIAWLAALLVLAAELAAGALHLRMAYYGAATGTVVLGAALRAACVRLTRDPSGAKAAAMLGAFLLAGAAGAGVHAARPFLSAAAPPPGCAIGEAAAGRIAAALPQGAVVAADIWTSPELLWRTGLRTIAGPYHRNLRGISDLGRIFMGTDDPEIRGLLARREAVAVLACRLPRYVERGIFARDSLQRRLAEDRVPAWLEEVAGLGEVQVRLYRLRPEGKPGSHFIP